MAEYFCRADGTAVNKAAAIGPASNAANCMTFAVHNAETFSPGDIIYLSDQGGNFEEILVPPSSGSNGSPITYIKETGETPVISGSDTEATPSYERSECVDIDSKSYITIDGIEFRYSGGVGVVDGEGCRLSNASKGIVIQNCHGHHHKNEALKLHDTCEAESIGNEFHNNIDSDISQHDDSILYSTNDELYDSPRGIENIGASKCYVDGLDAHGHTVYAIQLYLGTAYIKIINSTLDMESDPANPGGISIASDCTAEIGSVTEPNVIKNCFRGVWNGGAGTVHVVGNTFKNTTAGGIYNSGTGIMWVTDNVFKKCLTFSINNNVATATMYLLRNRNTDLAGSYSQFASLIGLFYAAGNIIDNVTSYAFYCNGVINPLSIIANNYVNDSPYTGIRAYNYVFIIRNNAIRSSVQNNYMEIDNCTVENNISDKADLPVGDGNVNSATFTEYFESIVSADDDYALPIEDAGAHGTGTDPSIAEFLTYFNDIDTVFSDMDIGAKGIERPVIPSINNNTFGFTKVSVQGNIHERVYHRSTIFQNRLYMLMGADLSSSLGDMCYTNNLQKWNRKPLIENTNGNAVPIRRSFGLCEHNNRVYLMGGYNGSTRLNDVYVTSNMARWNKLQNAPWSGRMEFGLVSFQGKIWAIGGQNNAGYTNEIWSTTDGTDWTQEGNAPWAARMSCGCVVFKDMVYVIGGIGSSGRYSDVWQTSNLRNWTCLTKDAGFAARDYHAVTCRNGSYIVVAGGLLGTDPTVVAKDIWYSRDGVQWYYGGELSTVYLYGHSMDCFNNRLVIVGGSNGTVMYGDVWEANKEFFAVK